MWWPSHTRAQILCQQWRWEKSHTTHPDLITNETKYEKDFPFIVELRWHNKVHGIRLRNMKIWLMFAERPPNISIDNREMRQTLRFEWRVSDLDFKPLTRWMRWKIIQTNVQIRIVALMYLIFMSCWSIRTVCNATSSPIYSMLLQL